MCVRVCVCVFSRISVSKKVGRLCGTCKGTGEDAKGSRVLPLLLQIERDPPLSLLPSPGRTPTGLMGKKREGC